MFVTVLFDEFRRVLEIDLKRGEILVVRSGERVCVLIFDARGWAE